MVQCRRSGRKIPVQAHWGAAADAQAIRRSIPGISEMAAADTLSHQSTQLRSEVQRFVATIPEG
jgi:hypothetical protein